jgi:predicted glycosyltransferase
VFGGRYTRCREGGKLAVTNLVERTGLPCVMLVCELFFGMGHLARTTILAEAFRARFRTLLIVISDGLDEVSVPAGVELHRIARPAFTDFGGLRAIAPRLLAIAANAGLSAVLVEYFPFGRHFAAPYLLPFIKGLRTFPGDVKIFCTLRDIQQRLRPDKDRFDRSVVRIANEYFDGILLHSDPRVTRLEDTFARTSELTVPVEYTNYVSRHRIFCSPPPKSSNTVVVSAGGGRGGEILLQLAVAAARSGLLHGYNIRVFGGIFLNGETWSELNWDGGGGAFGLELFRWTPDLFTELRTAAVSVSRCGYNTAQDLIASRVPALVIPYATPHEDEQTVRAAILSRMGLVRTVSEAGLKPESLAREILLTAACRPARADLELDGAERTCAIVAQQIAAQASGRPVA